MNISLLSTFTAVPICYRPLQHHRPQALLVSGLKGNKKSGISTSIPFHSERRDVLGDVQTKPKGFGGSGS